VNDTEVDSISEIDGNYVDTEEDVPDIFEHEFSDTDNILRLF